MPAIYVVPVRFVAAGKAIQTTTRALTVEGVFVRALIAPRPGTRVELRIHLPGGAPLELTGLVRERQGRAAEPGFWADFLLADQAARQRISRAVAPPVVAPPAQKVAAERRALPRLTTRLRVGYSTVDSFMRDYATNLSAGGLFIETLTPPARDEVVDVTLELPGSETPLHVRALVVHTVQAADAQGRAAGCGVQFIDADDSFRARLDAYIDRCLQWETG